MTQPDPRRPDPTRAMPSPDGFSVVIPAYDEESGIADSLRELHRSLESCGRPFEVIVVDDGSHDATAAIARREGVTVISHSVNRGYGAALKTGIRRARYDTIVITDADGTYPSAAIPKLVERLDDSFEMAVGARIGDNVAIPWARRPAKWLLRHLASYLVGQPIPDLNSGLRAMKRSLVQRYEHLLPSGFSFTTTITLAALSRDHLVHYESIDYRPRQGSSKIRPAHAFDFLLLILRTMVYFNPLKIFLPLGGFFFVVGLGKFAFDLTVGNLSESAIFALLTASLVWAVGLISDQISRVALRPGPW